MLANVTFNSDSQGQAAKKLRRERLLNKSIFMSWYTVENTSG